MQCTATGERRNMVEVVVKLVSEVDVYFVAAEAEGQRVPGGCPVISYHDST